MVQAGDSCAIHPIPWPQVDRAVYTRRSRAWLPHTSSSLQNNLLHLPLAWRAQPRSAGALPAVGCSKAPAEWGCLQLPAAPGPRSLCGRTVAAEDRSAD